MLSRGISPLILLLTVGPSLGMLVKDWGTGSQVNRLTYATYDLFSQAFDLVTAAQNDAYPIEDLKSTFLQEWRGGNYTVDFKAYNGWLDSLTMDVDTENRGNLRRFVMSSLNDNSNRNYFHEMYMCDNCLTLKAKGIHYAFESTFHKYETQGTIANGPIQILISFKMNVLSELNMTLNREQCTTTVDALYLTLDPNYRLSSRVKGIDRFSFLSNYLDLQLVQHMEQVVLPSLLQRMEYYLRKVLNRINVCDQFLSS